ncbi:MAG: hypothetical protein ACJ76Y_16120 [Thermoanaerobaculia bacterium]
MNKTIRLALLVVLFSLASRTGSAQSLPTQARPDEAMLGPFPIDQTVQGVPVSTNAYVFLAVKKADDPIEVGIRIVADLSDLQRKIGALVDTIPLPTDNCAHFGVDNVAARIWGKQLLINGDTGILKLNGDVDVWTCAKNPIPCTKLEGWNLVVYDCNPPIKNRNINQPFEASLPFHLELVDQHTVAVKLGDPNVNLGGLLGGVTNGILRIAGVDINARAKQALESAINPDLLKKSIPRELLPFNPVFTKAELLGNSGALAATLEMNVSIDNNTFAELGKILQGGSQPVK